MEPDATTVTIYGQQYAVRGDADPAYVREVAAFVDARMREVASTSSQVSSLRVAILAALNIAQELFQEREAQEAGLDAMQRRAEELARTLEQQLRA